MHRPALNVGAALCLALGTTFIAAAAQERDSDAPAARAAAMFAKQCADCHTVPSQEIRTDRAWLKQVADTA